MRILFTILSALILLPSVAQTTFPVNGPRDERNISRLLTNAVIHVDPETVIENGALLIKDNKIVSYGSELIPQPGTEVIDLKGRHIYPAFIDLYASYGLPKVTPGKRSRDPQYEREENLPKSWNDALHPGYTAVDEFQPSEKDSEPYLKAGFGAVLTHRPDGIARGVGALVAPGDGLANKLLLQSETAAFYSFKKGSSTQKYPGSLMGAIALLRQTHYDAQWYKSKDHPEERNVSLEAWNRIQSLPQFFELTEKNDLPRVHAIGEEFELSFIIKSAGDDYQWLEEVKRCGFPMVVPLSFPEAYDVEDPYNARLVSLQELKHWETAPANPAILHLAEVPFSLTMNGIEKPEDFLKNLRKAVRYGLDTTAAIEALTMNPARFIEVDDILGSLTEGKLAHFIITSGDIFDSETEILETWNTAGRHRHFDFMATDIRGLYNLNLDNHFYSLKVEGELDKPKAKIMKVAEGDTNFTKVHISLQEELITLSFNPKDEHYQDVIRFSGNIHKQSRIWEGRAHFSDGSWLTWTAIRQKQQEAETAQTKPTQPTVDFGVLRHPNRAYGLDSLPKEETIWFTGATVWTSSENGVLENGEVLVHKGKIVAVGKRLKIAELIPKSVAVREINLQGKHLTAGLIDEHSHIAISRGVNEGTQASTAEVRIGDVINPDDINIYRHLAGGVTTVQQLHGSANPIGGQSSIIKMRWGRPARELKLEGAPGFIKFALGENVKQSNWGDYERIRYPQTRMGVEQVYYDHFHQAREYDEKVQAKRSSSELKAWQIFKKKKEKQSASDVRVDLDLKAIAEILKEERFITCHSYVQSEINMLMHVGDSMGFRVNTFTHILEGYKVADKMREHGAGGSTFSDWWAYKFEVNDAIPYNAALMHQQGVVVAMNSDDAELARRLNHEAAKAVKYGGVSETEALNMVTINPAKLLHIDDRVGSIEPGKEADLVIWSDHPLSIYALPEKTFVDGRCYFDRSQVESIMKRDEQERARILARMLESPGSVDKREPSENPNDKEYHCDDVDEEI